MPQSLAQPARGRCGLTGRLLGRRLAHRLFQQELLAVEAGLRSPTEIGAVGLHDPGLEGIPQAGIQDLVDLLPDRRCV